MFHGITSVLWVLTGISYYRKKFIFKNPHTKENFHHGAKTITVTRTTITIILGQFVHPFTLASHLFQTN